MGPLGPYGPGPGPLWAFMGPGQDPYGALMGPGPMGPMGPGPGPKSSIIMYNYVQLFIIMKEPLGTYKCSIIRIGEE